MMEDVNQTVLKQAVLKQAVIERLLSATNAHDLDALVGCFSEDYRNETPAHPARGFTGRAQVRANWQQIFAFVPDLGATVLASVSEDSTVWSEGEMTAPRRDGTQHLMRGVIVFGLDGARAAWAR